jgi:hypothetical protein
MKTIEKLNALGELEAKRTILQLDKDKLIEGVLTPEIKQALKDIDDEFSETFKAIDGGRKQLEDEIKSEILTIGESVKGEVYRASFVKGRIAWDTDALEGYAAAHPEIMQFKKEGSPSVRISKV